MKPPSLDTLRELHLPPTPLLANVHEGWLAAILLAAVGLIAWLITRHLRRRPRAVALRELARLSAAHARDADAVRLACGISQLLRRHAVATLPQPGIAGLVGADWLRFLDEHGGNGEFARGAGAVLESLPYRKQGELDATALLALARRWLKQARP